MAVDSTRGGRARKTRLDSAIPNGALCTSDPRLGRAAPGRAALPAKSRAAEGARKGGELGRTLRRPMGRAANPEKVCAALRRGYSAPALRCAKSTSSRGVRPGPQGPSIACPGCE